MTQQQKVVFMSGLPRSGSTLLMNILAQNPRIQPSGTSGLFEVILGMRNQYTASNNVKAQDEKEMDARFKAACRGAILGWGKGNQPIYVDKSRGWPQHIEFLTEIGIKPYVIVTIRDLRAVLASMEKLYRNNSLRIDPVAGATTTENRVKLWAGGVPVGEAANQIQDIFTRGLSPSVIFVKYEDLVVAPDVTLSNIYNYIEEDEYVHDFDNVVQVTKEDDRLFGIPNLHNIRPKVAPALNDAAEIIGRETCAGILQGAPWFYHRFYQELMQPAPAPVEVAEEA
jgi:sulfotransferase